MTEVQREPSETEELASRLRAVQADLADEAEDVRQAHLCEQIRQMLSQVGREERPAYLRSLAEHFPVQASSGGGEAVMAAGEGAGDSADASSLVVRLGRLLELMEASEREELSRQLEALGLTGGRGGGSGTGEADEAGLARVREALKLGDEGSVDVDRALELLAILSEFMEGLDGLVWRIWKQVASRSQIARGTDAAKLLGRYVQGDSEISGEQVRGEVEQLRRLTASLLSVIGQLGRVFATQHLSRYAPSQVRAWADSDARSFSDRLVASEVRYWRKYEELTQDLDGFDAAKVESEMKRLTGELAEHLLRGGK